MATGCRCGRQVVCFCSVMMFLLLAEVAFAFDHQVKRETGVVGSMQERYLRGNTVTIPEIVSTEVGERYHSFEEFERRELVDAGYPSDPADPNCDNDPTVCPP